MNPVSNIFDFTAKADSGSWWRSHIFRFDRILSFAENAEATPTARWE
jgi:hypothetical protein